MWLTSKDKKTNRELAGITNMSAVLSGNAQCVLRLNSHWHGSCIGRTEMAWHVKSKDNNSDLVKLELERERLRIHNGTVTRRTWKYTRVRNKWRKSAATPDYCIFINIAFLAWKMYELQPGYGHTRVWAIQSF